MEAEETKKEFLFTKEDLFEAYKQSSIDGGSNLEDEALEPFFERWLAKKLINEINHLKTRS